MNHLQRLDANVMGKLQSVSGVPVLLGHGFLLVLQLVSDVLYWGATLFEDSE